MADVQHSALTTTNLHNPKGMTVDTTSTILTIDSSGNVDFTNGSLSVNSIIIIGSDGEVNKSTVEDSSNWDAAYSHISADGSSHTYIDQSVISGGSPIFAGLNPTATSDLALFGTTDVANDADGKKLIIHRKAAEGDGFFRMYVDQYNWGQISSSGNLKFFSSSDWVRLEATEGLQIYGGGAKIRHYGTYNAADQYVDIDEASDYYTFTRSHADVLGMDIQMPLITDLITSSGGIIFPTSDPSVAGAWWDNAGTLTKSAG